METCFTDILWAQNPLHDSAEFYVQCAIKFVHEHENFRQKPLKGRGRIRKGKERGPPLYFVQPPNLPRVPSNATVHNIITAKSLRLF